MSASSVTKRADHKIYLPTYMYEDYLKKIPLAPIGVLAPGSAHARPSPQPPIDTRRNFSVHMSEALASFL